MKRHTNMPVQVRPCRREPRRASGLDRIEEFSEAYGPRGTVQNGRYRSHSILQRAVLPKRRPSRKLSFRAMVKDDGSK